MGATHSNARWILVKNPPQKLLAQHNGYTKGFCLHNLLVVIFDGGSFHNQVKSRYRCAFHLHVYTKFFQSFCVVVWGAVTSANVMPFCMQMLGNATHTNATNSHQVDILWQTQFVCINFVHTTIICATSRFCHLLLSFVAHTVVRVKQ